MDLPLTLIRNNPQQPRSQRDPDEVAELRRSLHENGQLQPILVEANPDGTYTCIAGETRLLCARDLGWETIRADVRPYRNGTAPHAHLLEALVENLNRADMHPLDEGEAFERLIAEYGMSQVTLGHKLGKGAGGQVYVSNRRILAKAAQVPEIRALILAGWHVHPPLYRAMLQVNDVAARVKLAQTLYAKGAGYEACTQAFKRLAEALTTGAPPVAYPALALAEKRGQTAGPDTSRTTRTRYDALVHTGILPPWTLLRQATADACEACVWHTQANERVCGECPAVAILQNIFKRTLK